MGREMDAEPPNSFNADNLSPSVIRAVERFGGQPIPPEEFAFQLLVDHNEYGGNRGKAFSSLFTKERESKGRSDVQTAERWIESIRQYYVRDAVITGRCAIVGLAIVSE